ncbi:hypothetical protein Bpfe_001350, partial [Biomphalaria pfeifferi]
MVPICLCGHFEDGVSRRTFPRYLWSVSLIPNTKSNFFNRDFIKISRGGHLCYYFVIVDVPKKSQ